MRLFGNATDAMIVEDVEQATSDKLVEENWQVIMNICDKAGKSSDDAKAWLRAIVKRLYNTDPHVGLKAVTVRNRSIKLVRTPLCLNNACIKNSGKNFHVEVASREFENDFTKLMTKGHPQVARKLRESLKRWCDNEFKTDVQLSLIPALYHKLRSSYDFTSTDTPTKTRPTKTSDPNAVESQEEEDQILKAIALSLKETTGSPKSTSLGQPAPSLYPTVNNLAALSISAPNPQPAKELRKVRALYDFEAAEDNELTFSSGEINPIGDAYSLRFIQTVMVIDDSDPNWWKGNNQRGEGLFPANFVTADLSVEPEKFLIEKAKKSVQFKAEVKAEEKEPEDIEINEDKINRLLHLLHEADPTNPETDTDELLSLEREVIAMGPLIDTELERVDRKHAQLTQLSANLVEALGLYHTLMREPQIPNSFEPTYGYAPVAPRPNQFPQPPMGMYQMQGPPQAYQPPLPHPQPYPMPNLPMGAPQPGSGAPHGFPPVMDERMMAQYSQGVAQPPFPNSGPFSQTNFQGGVTGAPQQPHYVTSSTHMH
ncbi:hypothetical protein HUJ04_005508 [Dendroctonus ponderosae]|nr:hypothetical protein HUJ04_005508 [Dendroctonus ponderosae]